MNGAQNEQQQGPQVPPQAQPGTYGAGYGTPAKPNFNRKSPAMATWLSLMPGLGQIYVGYYQQGFINILVISTIIAILASSFMRGAEPFFGTFIAFYWIFQMIDANRRAHHYNRVMEGLAGEDVPDGFSMPSTKGSMLGGSVLVLVGVLFILDLNFDISMEWVENWWPLILILAGVNLVYKARKNAD